MCWDGGWTRKALYLWGIILGSCCCCCTAQHANYIFVLDAGSSGTRGYAFSYRMSQSSPFLPKFIPIPPSAAARQIPRKLGVGRCPHAMKVCPLLLKVMRNNYATWMCKYDRHVRPSGDAARHGCALVTTSRYGGRQQCRRASVWWNCWQSEHQLRLPS